MTFCATQLNSWTTSDRLLLGAGWADALPCILKAFIIRTQRPPFLLNQYVHVAITIASWRAEDSGRAMSWVSTTLVVYSMLTDTLHLQLSCHNCTITGHGSSLGWHSPAMISIVRTSVWLIAVSSARDRRHIKRFLMQRSHYLPVSNRWMGVTIQGGPRGFT